MAAFGGESSSDTNGKDPTDDNAPGSGAGVRGVGARHAAFVRKLVHDCERMRPHVEHVRQHALSDGHKIAVMRYLMLDARQTDPCHLAAVDRV